MTQKKKDIISSLAIHKKDVGSAEIQIGLLTDKISKLADHFKISKKDKHSSVGLTKSVNKRKKLLAYLKKKNPDSYQKVIKQLNLNNLAKYNFDKAILIHGGGWKKMEQEKISNYEFKNVLNKKLNINSIYNFTFINESNRCCIHVFICFKKCGICVFSKM